MSKNDSVDKKWMTRFTISRDISPEGFNGEVSIDTFRKEQCWWVTVIVAIITSAIAFFIGGSVRRDINAIWRAVTQDVCGEIRSCGTLILISLCMLFVIFLAMLLRSFIRDQQKNDNAREKARLDYQRFLIDKAFSVASTVAPVPARKIVIMVTITGLPCAQKEEKNTSGKADSDGTSK